MEKEIYFVFSFDGLAWSHIFQFLIETQEMEKNEMQLNIILACHARHSVYSGFWA